MIRRIPSRRCGTLKLIKRPSLKWLTFKYVHELGVMNWQQLLDTLDFHHKTLLDNEIDAMCTRQRNVSVYDWKPHLVLDMQSSLIEFVYQAGTNRAL
jgi:hypothetical protein